MDIWENRRGEIVILAVHGKLDVATLPLFEERVRPMLDRDNGSFWSILPTLIMSAAPGISNRACRGMIRFYRKTD